MPEEDRVYPMPNGLPACLGGGAEGFNSLCSLLGVVGRREKRQLLNGSHVRKILKRFAPRHAPGTRTAVRIREDLSFFFSLPDVRLDIWSDLYRSTQGFNVPALDPFPCLEYMALRNYGVPLDAGMPPEGELSGFADHLHVDAPRADWEAPALSAFPSVHRELGDWDALDKGRRRDVTLAAFAVATVLSDARLLRWAAGLNGELAAEFAFAADDPGIALPEHNPEFDAGLAVVILCERLIDTADRLADNPFDPSCFDLVAALSGQLAELREPVVELGRARAAGEALRELFALFEDLAEGDAALLDRMPEIRDIWMTAKFRDVDALRETAGGVRRKVADLFEEWSKARARTGETASLLSAAERRLAAASEGTAGEVELEVARRRYEHLLAAREKRDAEDRILAVMRSTKPPRRGRAGRGDAEAAPSADPGESAGPGIAGKLTGVFRKLVR